MFSLGIAVLLSGACAIHPVGGDYSIVPGKSLGSVSLGMDEDRVRAILREPADFAEAKGGALVEIWYGKQKRSGKGEDNFLRRDYVAVYYRDDRVVQIEATSKSFKTDSNLSTSTAVRQWFARFSSHKDWNSTVINLDPEGLPAVKHLLFYSDVRDRGIAWKLGAWGNGAPDPDANSTLESVIVHVAGQHVIPNPQDNKPYAGTPAYSGAN